MERVLTKHAPLFGTIWESAFLDSKFDSTRDSERIIYLSLFYDKLWPIFWTLYCVPLKIKTLNAIVSKLGYFCSYALLPYHVSITLGGERVKRLKREIHHTIHTLNLHFYQYWEQKWTSLYARSDEFEARGQWFVQNSQSQLTTFLHSIEWLVPVLIQISSMKLPKGYFWNDFPFSRWLIMV
jgi:hypothetical protein